MPLTKLRIVVIDDNLLFLHKLISLLSLEFSVIATTADGKTALDLIRRCEPDLVVLDLHIPGLNGLDITVELAKHLPRLPVVICTVETDSEFVDAARQAGATGYVFKTQVETDLILAVKSALESKRFVSAKRE
jgi:DNA-binding NarL/FixJ family response regulator